MIKQILLVGGGALLLAFMALSSADAFDIYGATNVWSRNMANTRPWHGQYNYTPYASPTALVVPPGVHAETTYGWGVSQNLMYPTYHQYGRSAPAYGVPGRGGFNHTPYWPSHTDQFGVYYVRGPWD